MPIEGVIFDLDGVLIDSAEAHHESWRVLAREHGLGVSDADFARTFGRQNRDIVPLLWGADVSPEQIRDIGERKEAVYRDLVRGRLRPLDGATDLVRRCLDDGLPLAIGSSTHPENLRLVLDELGWADCFRATVCSADVTRGKPHPDVFLKAAEGLGIASQRCVVIEDAPSGIDAARSAGCAAVGITSHHPRGALSAANLVVDHLNELSPAVLRALR